MSEFPNPIGSPTTVLICGGRDYLNYPRFEAVLNAMFEKWNFLVLIHGGARGADVMTDTWISRTCYDMPFALQVFPADWRTHGRRAGYLRNLQMAEEGRPDVVVAFPGGVGTEMMIEIARDKNIPAIRVSDNTMSRCH
ncbi:MAG: SLOG family protein [bacterium]